MLIKIFQKLPGVFKDSTGCCFLIKGGTRNLALLKYIESSTNTLKQRQI